MTLLSWRKVAAKNQESGRQSEAFLVMSAVRVVNHFNITVACSASGHQGSELELCVWRTATGLV